MTMVPFTSSSASACLLPLTSKPSKHGRRRLSCKAMASSGDDDDSYRIDRRDVLLGLTAATTGSTLGRARGLLAAEGVKQPMPITSEVLKCVSAGDFVCPAGSTDYDDATVVNFSDLPAPTGPPRVRRPAHLLSAQEVEKLELALQRMKELPDDDPRSFKNQAAIHEAYCDGKYNVVARSPGEPDATKFDVHFSSIFAPWHRMYIYFFEGILGELVGDPAFGLPYWNWDAPAGMMLPAAFTNPDSPLYDANRKPENERGAFIDLSLSPKVKSDPNKFKDDLLGLIDSNLCAMYRQMNVKEPVDFHGGYPSRTTKPPVGSLETGAHTAAHIWVGEHMGNLKTAARDPVFYSNHSNVDRMWHLWSTKLGNHEDLTNDQWLNTNFVFYDETKRPVRIAVRDVLDAEKQLGYTYEEKKSLEWMERRIKPAAIKIDDRTRDAKDNSSLPLVLKKGRMEYLPVERPKKDGTKTDEVLVVDVTLDPCEQVKFDVLVNVPRGEEDKVGPQNSQFAGSFSTVPHGGTMTGSATTKPVVSCRFKLQELIQDLNCNRSKMLNITLVPVEGDKTIVDNLRVELC